MFVLVQCKQSFYIWILDDTDSITDSPIFWSQLSALQEIFTHTCIPQGRFQPIFGNGSQACGLPASSDTIFGNVQSNQRLLRLRPERSLWDTTMEFEWRALFQVSNMQCPCILACRQYLHKSDCTPTSSWFGLRSTVCSVRAGRM